MRVLGFDTATRATTVALADGDRVLERRDDPPPGARPRHASRLMPMVADLLAEAGWGVAELDRIAVGVGPGTFTGLRIGVATARALAQACGVELVGVSTLESLARGGEGSVCAVLDARRGEVFAAAWDAEAPLLDAAPLAPAVLAQRLEELGRPMLVLGDGAIAFRDVLEQRSALIPDDDSPLHRVTAVNHCRLGVEMAAGDVSAVLPDYIRLPDAELARRKS